LSGSSDPVSFLQILKMLLARCGEAELTKPNKTGRTPSIIAVLHEHGEALQCLLAHRRSSLLDLADCLNAAAQQGNSQNFSKVLETAKAEQVELDALHTAMVTAAENGHSECLGQCNDLIVQILITIITAGL
jgi:ankyrin repeat protein